MVNWRPRYVTFVDPDPDAGHILFWLTLMALYFTCVGGHPQPLTILLMSGVTALAIVFLAATSRLRRVSGTAIGASDMDIVVIRDSQHDVIVAAIEAKRAAWLLRMTMSPRQDLTVRSYLEASRWLAENGGMEEDEYARRQALLLPADLAPTPAALPPATLSFRQRRPGATIDVTLFSDRLVYSRSFLLAEKLTFTRLYQDLDKADNRTVVDNRGLLFSLIVGWCGIGVLSAVMPVMQSYPRTPSSVWMIFSVFCRSSDRHCLRWL